MSADESKGLQVYLAGRYARRDELRAVASELNSLGYGVTSRWLFVDASASQARSSPASANGP